MLAQQEFEAILEAEKRLHGDIWWSEDEDHSPTVEFVMPLETDEGWCLDVKGSFNSRVQALSFTIIYQKSGRIYALDLGKRHRNPDGQELGDLHKHKWNEPFRDKEAYIPKDITETVANPVAVWKQFCAEFRIVHSGRMQTPIKRELF